METNISRVHIAALTNLTEGKVTDEHMTIRYFPNISKIHLITTMELINRKFPIDLNDLFIPNKLTTFKSWTEGWILTPETGHRRWEKPYESLFGTRARPHITLAKMKGNWRNLIDPNELNWEHGLLVDQVHAGFKVNDTMKYFTSSELARYNDGR